ncbi:hypothetical protein BESB_032860 [Besnoitia besnoiti]|uniref:Uncharacterized protein n=1 Tax=Besnoitia besnoiti TaxID=94643 RepID=A0A2A9LZB1_BESBE|nr:uncharacterized protein BESB_032860 [Besnoitia besnoiti]PFH31089.1 hypothetical protein BESB_032860 [Besnoitia besnoiti]
MMEQPAFPALEPTQVAVNIHYVSIFRSSIFSSSSSLVTSPQSDESGTEHGRGDARGTSPHEDECENELQAEGKGRRRTVNAQSSGSSSDPGLSCVFIGDARAWGAGISGISRGDYLLVLPSRDQVCLSRDGRSLDLRGCSSASSARDSPAVVVSRFPSCLPLPLSLLAEGEQGSAAAARASFPDLLLRLAFTFPRLLEALSCTCQFLRPEEGETVAICCASLHQASALAECILPLGATVHVLLRDPPDEGDSGVVSCDSGAAISDSLSPLFFKHPAVAAHRHNLHVHRVGASSVPDVLLGATADLGVDALLLLPGCEGTATTRAPCDRAREEEPDAPSAAVHRSLLSTGLACISIQGRVLAGCDVRAADEFEVDCMRRKAATLTFLASPLSLGTSAHLGKTLHLAVHAIRGVAEGRLWSPSPSVLATHGCLYSLNDFDGARRKARDRTAPGDCIVCTRSPV